MHIIHLWLQIFIACVKKHEDKLDRALAAMPPFVALKAFKVKQAARETARQRLLLTAWEIEEAERVSEFLGALYNENEQRYNMASDELERVGVTFCGRSCEEVDDDTDYFQAVYDEELEILKLATAQTEQIAKHLRGPHHQAMANAVDPGDTADSSMFGVEESGSEAGSPPVDTSEDSTDEDD